MSNVYYTILILYEFLRIYPFSHKKKFISNLKEKPSVFFVGLKEKKSVNALQSSRFESKQCEKEMS